MQRLPPLLLKMEATAELSSFLPSFTNFLSNAQILQAPRCIMFLKRAHTVRVAQGAHLCVCVCVSPSGSCAAESKHVIGL